MNDVNKDADAGLPPNKIVCVHRGMARSCSMCELERENARLKDKVEGLIRTLTVMSCAVCPALARCNQGAEALTCKEELEAWANEGI